MRLDQYLLANKYAFSRNKAQELIKSGYVKVNEKTVKKPSFDIKDSDTVKLSEIQKYVSRAAYKLVNYMDKYNLDFKNKTVLDIGSSTGGFTQAALEYGAEKVVCVDVGNNQLHYTLREKPNIEIYENTDIRNFKYEEKFDVIVSDVSFISLIKIIDKINELAKKDIILLFKPQFEVGRYAKRNKKGVVIDTDSVNNARKIFESRCEDISWKLIRSEKSSIKGKEGNEEFIYHFIKV